MIDFSRRDFLRQSARAVAGCGFGMSSFAARAQEPGARPSRAPGIRVLNPRARVPVGLIVDDSTCLANLARFCLPQFKEVLPEEHLQAWEALPREIPDSFVRRFAEWCRKNGVKGKYSMVPYPACAGRLDQELPGWSKAQLGESLKLHRTLLAPDWDFTPEMVTHTWAIDTKTGRPYPEHRLEFTENWGWTKGKSADQLADYIAYALRILKNAGIDCGGVTSPGGFGNGALAEYSQAVLQACRDVSRTEIPFYVKRAPKGDPSVAPRIHYASGLDRSDPKCVVQIVAGTGDWFGGWDGLTAGEVDKLITADGRAGRLPEIIHREEPALMLCHWPGMYFNGQETGFSILQEATRRLRASFDNILWMKISDLARYWAARELTRIDREGNRIRFSAPFASPLFTVEIPTAAGSVPSLAANDHPVPLKEVARPLDLENGTWTKRAEGIVVCIDLPKGESRIEVS